MGQINLILPQLKYATRDISEDHKINASYLFYYESIDLPSTLYAYANLYDIIFYNDSMTKDLIFVRV